MPYAMMISWLGQYFGRLQWYRP